MKKLVKLAAALSICLMVFCSPAKAMSWDTAIASLGTAVQSVSEGYEISVIQRMAGRAGAYTADGAKGIVHEIMCSDRMNFKNLFTGKVTRLEQSSTNPVSDLLTTNKAGEVIGRYQSKVAATDNSINKLVQQSASGKYDSVQLIGPKETAKAYNPTAAKKGLAHMESSGISTKRVKQTAERFLNPGSNASQALRAVGRAGTIYGGVKTVSAVAESVARGDDANELIAHAATEGSKGWVTGATSCAAGEVVVSGLALAGVSNPVALAVGGAAVSSVVAPSVKRGLDKLADQQDVEGKLTESVAVGTESVSTFANDLMEKIDVSGIGNWVSNAANSAKSSVKGMWEKPVNIGN